MSVGGVHSFVSTLPMFTLIATGVTGNVPGNFASSLPMLTLSASGFANDNGDFNGTLPMFTLDAFLDNYSRSRII
jgi:hypothetical protein